MRPLEALIILIVVGGIMVFALHLDYAVYVPALVMISILIPRR